MEAMEVCEEGCVNDDDQQRSRGISEASVQTVESYIEDDADDTNDCSRTSNNNDDNNNNTNNDNNDINEECLKLCGEDTNSFYLVDIGDGDLLQKKVNEKRNSDEVKRKEYSFNRSYHQGYPSKRNNRKWKYLSYILTILIVIMIFAFLWEFAQIQEIKTRLMMLHSETSSNKILLPKTLKSIQTIQKVKHRTIPPKEFTAISLTGNNQFQMGYEGLPIRNWQLHFQHGSIEFLEGKMISIKKSGLYQLYAQMFFYKNGRMYPGRNSTKDPVMDFGVRNEQTSDRIISATVALSSCLEGCTRHISSYVVLQEGDLLIVDTATPGVYFKMIEAKSLFGAYLVSDEVAYDKSSTSE